jgi:hypothetical protein
MERSSAIMHVLATAAQVDLDAAQLLQEIRRQRHTGQARIVAALSARDALDPELEYSEAADIAYVALSPGRAPDPDHRARLDRRTGRAVARPVAGPAPSARTTSGRECRSMRNAPATTSSPADPHW